MSEGVLNLCQEILPKSLLTGLRVTRRANLLGDVFFCFFLILNFRTQNPPQELPKGSKSPLDGRAVAPALPAQSARPSEG